MLVAGLLVGRAPCRWGREVRVGQFAVRHRAGYVAREQHELVVQPEFERRELAAIYVARGLSPNSPTKVARQLMADDALGAHIKG